MKIKDLLEANGSEHWTVHNMSGVPKKFKKIDGFWEKPTEVEAWIRSHGDPKYEREVDREQRKREREAEKAERDERRAARPPKVDLDTVWRKFEDVVGQVFPDGDPTDYMGPWFKRTYNIEYDWGQYLDKAAKKNGYKGGWTGYMAQMHDDYVDDGEPELDLHSLHAEPKQLSDKKTPKVRKKKNNPWR